MAWKHVVSEKKSNDASAASQSAPKDAIEPLADFDWTQTEPRRFRPFKPAYNITMALQSSTPSDLIVIDRTYLEGITERRRIIAENAATVLGAIPQGHGAVMETYTYLLGEYLPARYPTMFELRTSTDGSSTTFINKVTSAEFPLSPPPDDALAALRILAETVEDDMFLLVQQPDGTDSASAGEHMAVAFVCCHAGGFDPAEKLGKLLAAVHAPVPAYDKIGPSMERFFARADVGKSVKRINWAIQTHANMFAPTGNHVHAGDAAAVREAEPGDVDVAAARLRVELQTLSRLPRTRALLFSFKTYLYSLADVKAEGLGPQLAEAVDGLRKGNAPAMWVYKGGVRWGRAVCEHLRS
ncbi:hypothetical protein B0T26DRAFT_650927 [Lasiosphaeria miniovina]|uniref:Uncharacterized protein n=1 Tax=Lasiosphaeria miniovina TaxID=1954250 RepID=A0AA40ADQ4_9PEZI|nr:uncharacterized protein B0T26DRAFT_650927 [Lasiosphaeria miniovina]KAK0713966.1 hypothetical protein B0T26DRAFT_650927 [Lasiosphaeria miniovina]